MSCKSHAGGAGCGRSIALIAKAMRQLISMRTISTLLCAGVFVSPYWENIRSGDVRLSWSFYASDNQTASWSDLQARRLHEPTHHAMVDSPEAGR
uniref:Uncharacterized protein n=1 Tax=Ralstonia solanacearum TaxID=305 RepID=A0A0S4TQA8_RALSL|nr:protein of unknown function [Ralstonia solanacearum]